jgi:hypothetical protein
MGSHVWHLLRLAILEYVSRMTGLAKPRAQVKADDALFFSGRDGREPHGFEGQAPSDAFSIVHLSFFSPSFSI